MIETVTATLSLPKAARLEEINLPQDVVRAVAGTTVTVQILQEEMALTRQLAEPDGFPCLIESNGTLWNDYRPIRIRFTDQQGRVWRLPRFWVEGVPEVIAGLDLPVSNELVITDTLNLPTAWDLSDINIPPLIADLAGGHADHVQVRLSPGSSATVVWHDPGDNVWRIPHDWRRRRIVLPRRPVLLAQGIPGSIASDCANRIVSVNYHPGSRCCMPGHFRFRDRDGHKWPVRIADCTVVGFGNGPEFQA